MNLVSEKEIKIIKTLSNSMPNLSEFEKGYILGIAESKAEREETKKNDKPDKVS